MKPERDSLSANIMTRASLLFAPVMLAGCFTDSPTAKFVDYQERIANVQESDLLPPPELTLVELPSKRELTKEIPRTTLGLVDSYQLRKCQLFGLIAERNSVLGKVQDQFRNFDYQLKLIDGLERCLASNQIEIELKTSLQDILSVKYQYLPDYFFNLVYTSDAMRSQLNGHDWLVANKGSAALQVRESLTAFNQVAQFIATSDRATIERPPLLTPYQEQLEKSNVIGRLAFSLEASTLWMRTITNQLNTYDDQVICGKNRDSSRFKYLVNVFNNVFVEEVQPYLSYVDSEYQAIAQETQFVSALLSQSDAKVYNLHQRHLEFKETSREHVKYWKGLFERCGRSLSSIRNN